MRLSVSAMLPFLTQKQLATLTRKESGMSHHDKDRRSVRYNAEYLKQSLHWLLCHVDWSGIQFRTDCSSSTIRDTALAESSTLSPSFCRLVRVELSPVAHTPSYRQCHPADVRSEHGTAPTMRGPFIVTVLILEVPSVLRSQTIYVGEAVSEQLVLLLQSLRFMAAPSC
jgi:hypothetical protein